MKARIGKFIRLGILVFSLALLSGGCGGGGGTAPTGTVSISLTDAPGLEFDHVWITVQAVWFHTSDSAAFRDAGWHKVSLSAPRAVDLAGLVNGNLQEVWPGIHLPAGNYRQIRLFLASTEAPLTASASAANLHFNNEVDIGANFYPLRIPSPDQGIGLIPETPVTVTAGSTRRIAIDFDAGHVVVKAPRSNAVEYILKPLLGYFDLDHAGAIRGSVLTPLAAGTTFSNYTGYNFVIKAEQPNGAGTYRVVRRAATIDGSGNFVLYPLPIFGTATTARFDIVLRGRNVETYIVNQVPAHRGSTPLSNPTVVSAAPVQMAKGTEYLSNVELTPTGSWVNFYQTVSGEIPYEIRYRHVNPFTGIFFDPIALSTGPLHVGTWNGGNAVTFTTQTPVEGTGNFSAAADALLYNRSGYLPVTPVSLPPISFPPLTVSTPSANTASLNIMIPNAMMGMMNSGIVMATHRGLIVDARPADTLMGAGGTLLFVNLPGGTPANPFVGGFYGMFALGWNSSNLSQRAVGLQIVNLSTGNDAANLTMIPF